MILFAQQVVPYHHVYRVAMLSFILGNALHGLAQVNDIAQKTKQTRRKILNDSWVPLLVRGVICLALFLGVLEGQIADALSAAHVTLPSWASGLLGINVNNGPLAAICGYVFDSLLGYIPKIQKLGIPPSIDEPVTPGAPIAQPAPPANAPEGPKP